VTVAAPRAPRRLLAADRPVGMAARATVAALLDAMAPAVRAARAGDPEGIHQLRVAMRRLRASLALFEGALPHTVTSLEDELATLGRTVGAVRDLDVLASAVARHGRRIDAALAPASATIVRHVRERRAAAHALAVDALDAPRTRRLLERLARLADGRGGGAPIGSVAADLVRPLARDFARAARRVDAAASPAILHRARIRAKRLRYALEALARLGGSSTRELASRLAALQGLLGDQRDATTQHAWLAGEIPAFVGDAEALVAAGAIGEALRRRARKLARKAPGACRRVARPKLVAAALRELESAAPRARREAA